LYVKLSAAIDSLIIALFLGHIKVTIKLAYKANPVTYQTFKVKTLDLSLSGKGSIKKIKSIKTEISVR